MIEPPRHPTIRYLKFFHVFEETTSIVYKVKQSCYSTYQCFSMKMIVISQKVKSCQQCVPTHLIGRLWGKRRIMESVVFSCTYADLFPHLRDFRKYSKQLQNPPSFGCLLQNPVQLLISLVVLRIGTLFKVLTVFNPQGKKGFLHVFCS